MNPRRVEAIKNAPTRYFRAWNEMGPPDPPWAGARAVTPDGLPIIDRLPAFDNAFVATGHGMLGVTLGPATGAAVGALVTGGSSPAQLAPFKADRF